MAAENELIRYICLFHHRELAAKAIHDLEQAGFAHDALTIIDGRSKTSGNARGGDFDADFGTGYKSTNSDLSTLGVPQSDLTHLQEGLERGGVLLGVEAYEDSSSEIERILHRHTADKIDEAVGDTPRASSAALIAQTSVVVPIVDEELVVGKQQVDRGGVRIFRRVVSQPVTETVSLREERAYVEHRPAGRAATDQDLRAGDETIEIVETAEEPLVVKTARIVEEVHVGKQSSEHTETVRDTVRHTEVDVEPVGEVTASGTPARPI